MKDAVGKPDYVGALRTYNDNKGISFDARARAKTDGSFLITEYIKLHLILTYRFNLLNACKNKIPFYQYLQQKNRG